MSLVGLDRPLRIGFVGSGFMAHFHLASFEGVRNAEIVGVTSPTPARRDAFAARAHALGLGNCRAYPDIESLVVDGQVDALWVLNPNDPRLAAFAAIARAARHPGSRLRAVACEKPLGRTLAEAREVLALTEAAGLLHGYLEEHNAEQGEMPIVPDEAGIHGYTVENRHIVDAFRRGIMPMENFHDGMDVVRLVMALYRSVETGTTIDPANPLLETYVPVPARG